MEDGFLQGKSKCEVPEVQKPAEDKLGTVRYGRALGVFMLRGDMGPTDAADTSMTPPGADSRLSSNLSSRV